MNLYELFELCLNADYISVENDGDYAIIEKDGTMYLSFQCSDGIIDWQNNLDFPAEPYIGTDVEWYCHRGFLRVWRSVKPYIKDAILNTECRKIVIVGYSHGAAIATFAHEYVCFCRPDLADSIVGYGFGCPRCFFGRKIPIELQNRWESFHPVRNIDDIVTHMPPSWLGYRHVNNVIEIGERGKYSSIDAHRPESYLEELKNINIYI